MRSRKGIDEGAGRTDRRTRRGRDLRPRRRRARPAGRGRRADPRHVGRRARDDRDRRTARDPVRGRGLHRTERAADAVRAARRRAARLPRGVSPRWRPRCGHRPAGSGAWSTPWASRSTARGRCRPGPSPYPFRNRAAARACAPPRRRAARSRRARAQYLPHLLPRPAHGRVRRLRRRQIGAALDAGAQRRGGCVGDRPGRRARPRGAGIPPGRSRRRRPRALGGRRLDLGRAGADAPPGRVSDARDRRIFPR